MHSLTHSLFAASVVAAAWVHGSTALAAPIAWSEDFGDVSYDCSPRWLDGECEVDWVDTGLPSTLAYCNDGTDVGVAMYGADDSTVTSLVRQFSIVPGDWEGIAVTATVFGVSHPTDMRLQLSYFDASMNLLGQRDEVVVVDEDDWLDVTVGGSVPEDTATVQVEVGAIPVDDKPTLWVTDVVARWFGKKPSVPNPSCMAACTCTPSSSAVCQHLATAKVGERTLACMAEGGVVTSASASGTPSACHASGCSHEVSVVCDKRGVGQGTVPAPTNMQSPF